MQKTNKELAEFYGIEVGDTVRIYSNEKDYADYKVILINDIKLEPINGNWIFDPFIIADRKYEVIKTKKYGDLKCDDLCRCEECPLQVFTCRNITGNTLYGILEESCIKFGYSTDHPIYKAFKAELDKEAE